MTMSHQQREINHDDDELDPARYLVAGDRVDRIGNEETALIVLNSPIHDWTYFRQLYNYAAFRLYADGGANRVADLVYSNYEKSRWLDPLQKALPDLIYGDLDSLSDTTQKAYASLGVTIAKDPDQYSTDFGKAVKKVVERLPKVRDVLVVGSLGGRVDQGIGLIGEFYREQIVQHSNLRFWLFSEASISTILLPGTTKIRTPLKDGLLRRNIGILPVYGPAMISTTGLEWDVQDWPTEVGGQMSTSNHVVEDQISITTDRVVLFTIERVTDDSKVV